MEKEYAFVLISGVLSGLIVFGSKVFANMGLSLYQFLILSAIFLIPVLPIVVLRRECRIKKEMVSLLAAFGLLGAVMSFTEFGPVFLGVPVAVVVMLLYTQPLWTAILGKLMLKEDVTRRKVLAIIIVMAGVAILVNPLVSVSGAMLPGIILALAGGILLSVWVVMGRVVGIRKYNPVTTKFGYSLFMVLFLLMLYPIMSLFVSNPAIMELSLDLSPMLWLYLMIFSVFVIFINHVLYFRGVRKVAASAAGVILLLEIVSASALAAVFLQQPITLNVVLGGALILFSNYLVIRKG